MNLTNKKVAAVPILMVAIMVVFYIAFQLTYIRCDFQHYSGYSQFLNCTPVDVGMVFPKTSESSQDKNLFLQTKTPEQVRTLFADRYSGRQTWVFITFASVIACIGVFIVSSFLIHRSSGFRKETRLIRTIVLIGVSLLLGAVLWRWPQF